MSSFELKFHKTISAVERYYTITHAANQCIQSRTMEWTENYPRKVSVTLVNRTTDAAENLLSSSFAGWDTGVTGALDIGDRVEYSVYPTSAPTVKTRVFYGLIVELSQSSGGILTVAASDYLEKYEYLQPSRVFYSNYRDMKYKDWTQGTGCVTIDGVTESNIVWPAVNIAFAWTDVQSDLTATYSDIEPLWDGADAWYNAQLFEAKGNGLIGLAFSVTADDVGTQGTVKAAIQADSNGLPSGTDLGYGEAIITLGDHIDEEYQIDFTDAAGEPITLTKGRSYWVVWSTEMTDAVHVSIVTNHNLAANAYTDTYWWKQRPAGAWTESTSDYNFELVLDFAEYEDVNVADYYFDSGASTIVVKQIQDITTVGTYYDLYRGRVSYYYGTVSTENLFDKLIALEPTMTANTDSNLDTTLSIYQTRGKSVGECLRELGDTFETTGTYSGYQHAIAHYESGGTHYVKVGFRPSTQSKTFSHGADGSTDDELRLTSVDLKRTTAMRPASVMVIGKSTDGSPLICQRDDRAMSTSFRTKSKLDLLTTLTDESLTTLSEVNRKAWQLLDSYTRGTWEGTIVVAGVYPDLFDLNTASATYGAGGHILLNYSPLGISNGEFHVKGIVLHENTTEIQITNEDLLVLNVFTDARGRAERSEAFTAPDDPQEFVFVSGFYDDVETLDTLYAQLCSADNTPITGSFRVLCTKFASRSAYNTNTYHAEFELENGHTTDGSTLITQIELYDAATGGTEHAYITLSTGERVPKWRTTKVIAEVHTKKA